MRTIFKYPIKVTDQQTVRMPQGAKILCVQLQFGGPCLWAEIEDSRPSEDRLIAVVGTGNPIPEAAELSYVGTVQQAAGHLIWHVYEVN